MKIMPGKSGRNMHTAQWLTMGFSAMLMMHGTWLSNAGAGIILDGNYVAGKYYYEAPVATQFLMMRITYINDFSLEYPWRVYPGINHGYMSSGYQGFSAVFSLGPNLNENNNQTADWDVQFPSVNPYPFYRYKDVGPGESWSIALGVWSFSGPVEEIDGGVGIDYPSEKYFISFFDPGSTPGLSPECPILPMVGPSSFHFDLPLETRGAGVNYPVFVDPPVAIGYEYSVSSGPNFASILLPDALPGGDMDFDLTVGDSIYALTAGIPFDLTRSFPGGVGSFIITGIDPSEGLDPTNPTAFVTGLTFVEGGTTAAFEMKPIVAPIPEPSVFILLGMGMVSLIAFHWCR